MRTSMHTRDVPAPAPQPLEPRLRSHCAALVEALRGAVEAGADLNSVTPKDLATRLRVDKTLTQRLLRGLRTADPLHAAGLLPGTQGLELILRALARAGAAKEPIAAAEAALAAFDEFTRREIGGRGALEAILTGFVPDARRSAELKGKQAVFSAMSRLIGCEARAHIVTNFCFPSSDDPEFFDEVLAHGFAGFRRLNPRASFCVGQALTNPPPGSPPIIESPDGGQVTEGAKTLLTEFCSRPTPRFEVRQVPGGIHYMLGDEACPLGEEVSFFFAQLARRSGYRVRHGAYAWEAISAMEFSPARVLQFDVFVHESLWEGVHPELWISRRMISGQSRSRDADYYDRLDLLESIMPLGRGLAGAGSGDMRRYADMARSLCTLTGFAETEFRGYRCHIRYPVVGTDVCMRFRLPE